jgi:hypothetical protein
MFVGLVPCLVSREAFSQNREPNTPGVRWYMSTCEGDISTRVSGRRVQLDYPLVTGSEDRLR